MGYGHLAHTEDTDYSDGDIGGNGQADPPIFADQDQQDADDQNDVAQNTNRKLGEEDGDIGDVAINTLDHLAGGAVVMKGHIEPQAVAGQVGPQLVGGLPAYVLPNVGGDHTNPLQKQGRP